MTEERTGLCWELFLMNSTQRPESIHHCIVGSSETGRGQSIPAVKISTEFFITGKLGRKSYWAKNHF